MSHIVNLFPAHSSTLILDGAMATELEKLGADLNDPLWSCKTLLEQPDLIRSVHLAYFQAGADIAITASYQATAKGLLECKGFSLEESKELIRKSVMLAKSARDEVSSSRSGKGRIMLIAGSIGPYGAYLADGSEYHGGYSLPVDEMKTFHRPRIEALVEARVDVLALETMPNLLEIQALLELLTEEFPNTPAWLSCSMKNGNAISDGTPLKDVLTLAQGCASIFAIGVNCCRPETATQGLKVLNTANLGNLSLIVYPNSGEIWEASNNTWGQSDNIEARSWTTLVDEWLREFKGKIIIGGCCRTGPAEIQIIHSILNTTSTKTSVSQDGE